MTSKSLICDTIARRKTDRIPLADLAYWAETISRWEGEGLSPGTDPRELFGLDRIFVYYPDSSPRLEEKVVEDDEETVVVRDNYGRTVKRWRHSTATPVNLRYGIDDIAETDAYMSRYDSLNNQRADEKQVEEYKLCAKRGDFTAISPLEPAWFIIEHLLGFEQGLMAFIEYPHEVAAIMRRLMDYSLAHIEWLIQTKGIEFDALWFFSDLCFKNGMLLSPGIYRELVMPIHKEYKRFCDEHGMFLMLHCDGDVRNFIPLIIESGFDVIQPLEARAGNDVRELKELYGESITFFGNIDADIIANGTKDEIREEVASKVNAAKQGGGYMYHIDHSVPPTVSFENYRLLMSTLKENMHI